MQPGKWAEDELSQQLRAWEEEADRHLAMASNSTRAHAGGLSCDASAVGTAISFGFHACHSTTSLRNLAVTENSDDIYQNINDNANVYAAFSDWEPKYPEYEEVDSSPEEEDVSTTKEVAKKEQANGNTPPAGNKVFPSPGDNGGPAHDKDSVAAAVDAVKGVAMTGRRVALSQGMRRLLDRANNTRSAVRRGVRRVRQMVGIAYRHALHNSALTGGDKELCEPLLEDDVYIGQEDSGRRSLNEFLKADKRLFR